MGDLIKPAGVRVVTRNGEVEIHLEITLNLNLNGTSVQAPGQATPPIPLPQTEPEKEDTPWEIPDFLSPNTKLNFGKKVD